MQYKIKISLLVLFNILFLAQAQQVTNVRGQQKGLNVEISYTISNGPSNAAYEITVSGYRQSKPTQIINMRSFSNLQQPVGNGTYKFIWKAMHDMPGLYANDLIFVVEASYQKEKQQKNNPIINITPNEDKNQNNTFKTYTETTAGTNIKMVAIKGGTFSMGSEEYENEKPIHTVTLSNFYMAETEVTISQFAIFLNSYGSDKVKNGEYADQTMIHEDGWGVHKTNNQWQAQAGYEKHPVVNVTWYGAHEYTLWLSSKTGKKYSLPTEAQWEYAAGGGKNNRTKWAGTNNRRKLGKYAWYNKNSNDKGSADYGPRPVRTKRSNTLGLYDMSGNVWEWCNDWYKYDYYKNSPENNPLNFTNGKYRVLRGGAWYSDTDLSRVADRVGNDPFIGYNGIGLRVARLAHY